MFLSISSFLLSTTASTRGIAAEGDGVWSLPALPCIHSIPFHSISIPFYLCKIFTAFSKTLSVTHCSTVQVCIKFHDFAHKRVFSGSNTPGPPTQEGVTVQCICVCGRAPHYHFYGCGFPLKTISTVSLRFVCFAWNVLL